MSDSSTIRSTSRMGDAAAARIRAGVPERHDQEPADVVFYAPGQWPDEQDPSGLPNTGVPTQPFKVILTD